MRPTLLAALATLIAAPVLAQSVEDAVEARHGFMKMISFEMGTLSGMARGEIAYDEAAATTAAANLSALVQYDAPKLFVDGSSSADVEGTDALPAIWNDPEDFRAKFAALREATGGITDAVAGGQGNVGPVVQQLGVTCRDCHQSYRQDR